MWLQGVRKMINYNKNDLINTTLDKYYETFAHTLDTEDYVPEKYNNKICRYIFKNLKKSFRKINWEDRKFQRKFRKQLRKEKKLQQKQDKLDKKKQQDANAIAEK